MNVWKLNTAVLFIQCKKWGMMNAEWGIVNWELQTHNCQLKIAPYGITGLCKMVRYAKCHGHQYTLQNKIHC